VDATGIGQPVIDLLRPAAMHTILNPIYFTHGDQRTRSEGQFGNRIMLGKAWLVSRLQVLLQTERLHLPDTLEARTLAGELMDYEIHIDEDANERYGAFKVGSQDELVTALGLAVQKSMPASICL
jgi:hypothetical protein